MIARPRSVPAHRSRRDRRATRKLFARHPRCSGTAARRGGGGTTRRRGGAGVGSSRSSRGYVIDHFATEDRGWGDGVSALDGHRASTTAFMTDLAILGELDEGPERALSRSASGGPRHRWLRDLPPGGRGGGRAGGAAGGGLAGPGRLDLPEGPPTFQEAPARTASAARAARRADAQGGLGAARLRRGRGRRPDEPALRAAAPGHDRRRGDQLPAPPGARARLETIYYAYVLDAEQRLLGVVSFRDLFAAAPDKRVRDVMRTDVVTVPEDMDQEAVAGLRRARPHRDPGRRRRRPHEGHRHRRRHRRRRAGRGDRGHPEDRRHGGPRRALPAEVGFAR